jgi:hypothetical protein
MNVLNPRPYTLLDPDLYQKKMRIVRCPDCEQVYETDLPGPMCPFCHVYCLTIVKHVMAH